MNAQVSCPGDDHFRLRVMDLRLGLVIAANLTLLLARPVFFLGDAHSIFHVEYWMEELINESADTAPTMMLAFWVGMVALNARRRLLVAILGSAGLALGVLVFLIILAIEVEVPHTIAGILIAYFYSVRLYGFRALLIAAELFLFSRRYGDVRFVGNTVIIQNRRWQYTLVDLLLIMFVVGAILALAHNVNVGRPMMGEETFEHKLLRTLARDVVSLFAITVYATWATLGARFSAWRLIIVVGVAALIGLIESPLSGLEMPDMTALKFYGWESPTVLNRAGPAIIVIGSLLVVRSCGYRLVPKTKL